jgi:uncharacterized metal-binding protein YceD (DUF177 family)
LGKPAGGGPWEFHKSTLHRRGSMKHNREFEIAWQGLKPGPHKFFYDIDDQFMLEKGEADETLKDWNVRVNVGFDKHENFFMLRFDIDGLVTVPCDRCGDDFRMKLWDEFDLIIKLTDEVDTEEAEDDVVFIARSETVIDLGRWIYEFVMLSIPLQRVHPDKEDGASGCNPVALGLLDKLSEHTEPAANPIWKGLEQLKQDKKKQAKK